MIYPNIILDIKSIIQKILNLQEHIYVFVNSFLNKIVAKNQLIKQNNP